MPIDACPSTTCPASPGQKQTYSVVLPISKKFPTVSDASISILILAKTLQVCWHPI